METVKIIQLPQLLEERGNLTFIESDAHIPFKVKRAHWIYDVPGGEFRGSHAYKKNREFIIALSGSFDLVLHDGDIEYRYHLNRSYFGEVVPKMTWRMLENFSTNSLAVIIASTEYDANDYILDFEEFKKEKTKC